MRPPIRRLAESFIVVAGAAVYGGAAHGQTPTPVQPPVTVRVHVADSAGVPVAGADIAVMHGLNEVLARGQTDLLGDSKFTIPRAGNDVELVVRKIGYQRVSRFFSDTGKTLAFTVSLARTVRALDTVKVAAQEDVRRKSYFIGAEDIENSNRLVVDALDIVTKLRPDMIWGRAGQPDRIDQHASSGGRIASRSPRAVVAKALKFGSCAPVENIWVNGARIRGIAIDPLAARRRNGDGLFINPMIATVLASIKPEHIAEVEYHPCTDNEGEGLTRSNNSIMVRLKEGIGFDPGAGSYVASRLASGPAPIEAPSVLVRLLGVFDEASGEPVVGADVVEVATGTIARTTATGTVSLNFLPQGSSQVRIQREGYAPVTLPVTMSPRDTVPITIVLAHVKAPPPPRED